MPSDAAYQQAMVTSLEEVAHTVRAGRGLSAAEEARAADVRHWSAQIAVRAELLATIDPHDCLLCSRSWGNPAEPALSDST